MRVVVTPAQMRAAEEQSAASGTSDAGLMRAAAEGIVAWLEDQFHSHGEDRNVVGLVGPGNNGSDTLVVLALLSGQGWNAHACLVDRDSAGDLPLDDGLLKNVTMSSSLPDIDNDGTLIILDGIYGNGGRDSLSPAAAEACSDVRELRTFRELAVIAIDLPSGVDAESGAAANEALQADATLSLGAMKSGLMREPAATLAGEVVHVDIGLDVHDDSRLARMIDAQDVATTLPKRFATAGKHDYGGLLVVGGSPRYFGAPRLAVEAGLLTGTGIVGAAVPRMLISTIAIQVPEVVFVPLSDSDARKSSAVITEALSGEHSRYTAAVLGPGLDQDDIASDLLESLFGQARTRVTARIGFGVRDNGESAPNSDARSALTSVPLVLDADALNWLARQENRWSYLSNITCVLTPHVGELARLLETTVEVINEDRIEIAQATARDAGQVVVLKGGYAIVAAPDGRTAVAHRATPELATPGTGDVLSGLIGGFLAQGMDPFDAACAAIYVGAEAGRKARYAMSSRSVLARDLLANIGAALDDLDGTIW